MSQNNKPINKFKVISKNKPTGDQPKAIKQISDSLIKNKNSKKNCHTLLGVTGSGKTFSVSRIIQNYQRPTLVLAHNKTLAAQLYHELKELLPKNKVEYFVSYYDYYQPESYVAQRDLYIEKSTKVNQEIEKLRLSATASVTSRNDTVIVASVSCIYGLGNPKEYLDLGFELFVGQEISRQKILDNLVKIQFERNDMNLESGKFRVKGDVIDLIPGYYENIIRIEMFGDEIERIYEIDKMTGEKVSETNRFFVYPAKHFVFDPEKQDSVISQIKKDLDKRLKELPLLEADRLKKRTNYDIEMIEETGYCTGIENYSRYFDRRKPGERPFCLLDYFPKNFLLIIDESHQTIPQLNGMYQGDYSRKKSLVDYGFRLPSALDNRPLKFKEIEKNFFNNVVFVSATPSEYETKNSIEIAEQIIRPTGLVDPEIEVHPIKGQITHLLENIQKTIKKGYRILVTTLTKKLAEQVSDFISEKGINTRYLHSEIDTLERTELIRDLRAREFDVLVGINLLREGLDIPEVGLVAILDADKEGFLRDSKSLIQTIGRAARNSESRVILYADRETKSIKKAVDETQRRRNKQIEYNKKHNITPKTIVKPIPKKQFDIKDTKSIPKSSIPKTIKKLEKEMQEASKNMEFEKAIVLRDKIKELKLKK